MEDLISRQALCEYALNQKDKSVTPNDIMRFPSAQPEYNMNEWCTDCKEYDQERHCCPRFNRVIRETVDEVKNNQWIPCSESLPEEDHETGMGVQYSDYVLMTVFNEEDDETVIDYGQMRDGEWYSISTDIIIPNWWKVTAWMPLPEPYREGEKL